MKTLTFTGFRPNKIYGYQNKDKYMRLVDIIERVVEQFIIQENYAKFITGGAQGFDQLCFWAVNRLKQKYPHIKNIVYVPHENQPKPWGKDGFFGQDVYATMLKLADEVVDIAKTKNISTATKQGVIKALFARNEEMVKASDAIIGFYEKDKDFTKGSGGTAGCLAYASKQNHIKMHILDKNTLELS